MRLQPASSRAASCSFNFCSRRAVDIGVIELSHRGNKLPQQQRRRAANRRQWSAWTHPSELPAGLMLSALLRRPFLGFSVALFPFCAPVDCFCVNDAARRAAVGHALWDGRPPTHDGLGPPHALETPVKNISDQKSRRSKDLLLLCLVKASQTIPFSYLRITMPKINLSGM